MPDWSSLATPLLRATVKARSLGPLVVKLGGSAMEDPAATRGTLDSIAALHQLGVRLVLVHGGGKPIDRAMADAGIEPRKVQGRRVTDDATLEIVVSVLCEIAGDLVTQLETRGVPSLALTDAEMMPVLATRLTLDGEDLGHVGTPDSVDLERLNELLDNGMIPIIPSIALCDGEWLNVNADTMAAAIAGALKADAADFLTDTPGVLANPSEPSTLFARLTVGECQDLIAKGTINGGMIPKVEACFEALQMGAKRAVILDGRQPHSLLAEFVSDVVPGTEILP